MFDILIFLLVLSVLVGVHELGHFLAAKAFNIYVDRFSIGMPPRLFGFKWGETDYCVGALPLGGFVKMAGQEDAPLSEEERQSDYGHVPPDRWFNSKPVWQRIIVLVAGPAMNVVLAVLLYAIIGGVGSDVPEFEVSGRVGNVVKASPAAEAPLWRVEEGAAPDFSRPADATGLQTGDLLVSLNGRPVDNITDLAFAAILDGEGAEHSLVLEREEDGGTVRYASRLTPRVLDAADEYPRFGVEPFMTSLVDRVMPDMPAAEAGLQPEDIIVRADGNFVDRTTFLSLVENHPAGTPMELEIERGGQRMPLTLTPREIGRILGAPFGPLEPRAASPEETRPVILEVTDEFREQTGLRRKDVIAKVNGQPATVASLQAAVQESPGGTVAVEIERPTILFGLIQQGETLSLNLPVDSVHAIGIIHKQKMVFHRLPPSELLGYAFRQCYLALERTVLTIKALIAQDVSPTQLGGPLMIFDLTTKAAEVGWIWLFKISAFISVNLAVLNLLPLPVLDGGQVVVNSIEAIRRKPLSPIFLERFQQVGLLLILSLMLFVTWNDIGRWIQDIRP